MNKKHFIFIFIFFISFINLLSHCEVATSFYSELLDSVRTETVDSILLNLPKRTVIDILQMVNRMTKTKEKNSLNDAESAYLIYKWIIQNIEIIFSNERRNLELVYSSGKANCEEMSAFFNFFCSFFEIESQSISGYLKTLDNSKDYEEKIINIDFTWNYIAINNVYYLIDLASGAGFLYNANYKNERTDFYFGTKPEYFINTHYPNDSKWQLLSQNYSFEKFDSLPYIYYNFYLFGFETFSPETKDLNWNEEIKISLTGGESTVNADFLFEMYDNYRREYEIPDDVIKTEEKAEIILKIDKIKNPLYILLTDGVYPELILYKVNPIE